MKRAVVILAVMLVLIAIAVVRFVPSQPPTTGFKLLEISDQGNAQPTIRYTITNPPAQCTGMLVRVVSYNNGRTSKFSQTTKPVLISSRTFLSYGFSITNNLTETARTVVITGVFFKARSTFSGKLISLYTSLGIKVPVWLLRRNQLFVVNTFTFTENESEVNFVAPDAPPLLTNRASPHRATPAPISP